MDLGSVAQSWSTSPLKFRVPLALYPLTPSLPHNHEISHQLLESTHIGLKYTKRNFELAMEFKGDSVVAEDSRHGVFMKQALLMVWNFSKPGDRNMLIQISGREGSPVRRNSRWLCFGAQRSNCGVWHERHEQIYECR